jgi:carbonic anhydrase/acetyltransferase-like protein (isoleucine patch superfamily)
VIATNALVAKWKIVPDGEVWGGLPAKCIRKNSDRPSLVE